MRSPLPRSRSIRAHLLALIAVTALPLIALLAHVTRLEYDLSIEQGRLRARTLADATATSTQTLLSLVRGALEAAATDRDLLDPGQCTSHAPRLTETFHFLPVVVVVAPDASFICSTESAPPAATVTERDWFREVIAGADFAVEAPVVGQITGLRVAVLAVPVRGPDGSVKGVLAAGVPLVTFQDLLAGVSVGAEDLVTIANADRAVIVRSRDPDRWIGRPLPPLRSERAPDPGEDLSTEGEDAEGTRRSWAWTEIPELGWTVYGGIPLEEALGFASSNFRARVLIGALALLLIGLLGYLFQRRIIGALEHLVHATESGSDPETVSMPPGTPTEIAEVARRFNRALLARMRAEREERRAKERFRSIVDNAVLGIYVSTEDGSFLEVNPAFAALMGYDSPEELLATGPEALYRDAQQRDALIGAYHEGDLVEGVELEWMRKDGSPVRVRLHGKVLPASAGRRAFEIMVEDVTEQRRLEDQLRMTQKMEAVGRLAGGLAHDFNNVLTVIRVNAELAGAELDRQTPGYTGVEEIVRATEGAQRLTRQLLSFSRKRESAPELVRPNEVIRGVEKMLVRLIGEDVRLEAHLDPSVPWVRMDPGQLEQVLMNLVVNARDALPAGGRITLSTRTSDTPLFAESTPAGTRDLDCASFVVLGVEDDGIGMDAATRERIFEPFFTTKEASHGTGLGLSTAYAIVTGAGGRISVDSTPGQGTRFEVSLPAVLDGPPGEEAAPSGEVPLRGHGETVLLVEDNTAVRRAVQRTLEGAGYHVLLARDGQEGIDQLHGYGGHIDLVLTDVVMPNVSGPELADHVDRVRPTTPILFMSGYTAEHPMAERIARPGVNFIPKPFEISELLARIRSTLSERRRADRPDAGPHADAAAGRS